MMDKRTILVTNDDGPDSPFLRPFINALRRLDCCRELRAVVPAEEQSWISKSITRFKPLTATAHHFEETAGFLVSGTPADCVSLGLNNLFADRVAFVCSGINMGTNAGVPFVFSSGTVGGAIEAALYGTKSVAFSADLPDKIFHAWQDRKLDPALTKDFVRLAVLCSDIALQLMSADIWNDCHCFSVNVPWTADASTPRVLTRLTGARFVKLFTEIGENRYQHKLDALQIHDARGGELPGDFEVVQQGRVSITPLLLDPTAPVTKGLRSLLNL